VQLCLLSLTGVFFANRRIHKSTSRDFNIQTRVWCWDGLAYLVTKLINSRPV